MVRDPKYTADDANESEPSGKNVPRRVKASDEHHGEDVDEHQCDDDEENGDGNNRDDI